MDDIVKQAQWQGITQVFEPYCMVSSPVPPKASHFSILPA